MCTRTMVSFPRAAPVPIQYGTILSYRGPAGLSSAGVSRMLPWHAGDKYFVHR